MGAGMTFAEFQRAVAAGEVPPVVILHGEEPYLARLGVDLLRKTLLAPGSEAFDFVSLAGRETTAETVAAQASTVPMMSTSRLTVVYDFEKMSPPQRTKLLDYLKSPVEASCVALVSFGRLSGKNRFERDALGLAAVVDCGRLSRDSLLEVARRMARERDLEIGDDALSVLVDWTDGELNRIAGELGKLACYAAARGDREAQLADVEFVVGARASGLRDLARAIAEGRSGAALSLFKELVDAGADASQLVSQLYGLWTWLWSVRVSRRDRPRGYPGSGAYLLSGAPDLLELAARRTSREYARGIEHFYRADTDIRRGMPAETTVGLLVHELARAG